MKLNLLHHVPEGLTRRARSFVVAHGVQADLPDVEQYRSVWLESGIPADEIDRAVAFQRRWGGLVLPPAPEYDGGPRYFQVDAPDSSPAETADGSAVSGWWFEAGPQRTAVPYSFMIGPTGEFGIHDGKRWVPLHWWRGTDSLIAVYSGESICLGAPVARTALIYSGLDVTPLDHASRTQPERTLHSGQESDFSED